MRELIRHSLGASIILMCISCNTDFDCIQCYGVNLEVGANGTCKCSDDYYQIGTMADATCDQSVQIDEHGNCALKEEFTFYLKAGDGCYCSDYTEFDSVLVRLGPRAGGSNVVVTGKYASPFKISTGRLTLWDQDETGVRFVIDQIHIAERGGRSEFRNDCIFENRYGTMRATCNADVTECVGEFLWYERISEWQAGVNAERCDVRLYK